MSAGLPCTHHGDGGLRPPVSGGRYPPSTWMARLRPTHTHTHTHARTRTHTHARAHTRTRTHARARKTLECYVLLKAFFSKSLNAMCFSEPKSNENNYGIGGGMERANSGNCVFLRTPDSGVKTSSARYQNHLISRFDDPRPVVLIRNASES